MYLRYHGYNQWRLSMSRLFIPFLSWLLLVGSLTGCEQPASFKWQLQSQATPTSIDFIELKKMVANIKLMSNGRLDISAHHGGVITGGADIYTAVKEGRIQMGSGWPNWWSGQHPAWAVMNAGPFDFMNIDASMMFFLAGNGTKLANELALPDGVVWRPAWWPGMEFGLLSANPVTGIKDLKGKKIRIGPGLPSEVLAAATGAFAIPLVPDEIRPALENGDLDAVEWTTTAGAWNLGLNEITKHAIVPAIWQPSVLADFLINKEAYDALPADLKAILETAIKSYTLSTTMINKRQDFVALEAFKEKGTVISVWSDEDVAKWKKASDVVLDQYSKKDDFTKRLIQAKQEFKAKYNQYYQLFGPYD